MEGSHRDSATTTPAWVYWRWPATAVLLGLIVLLGFYLVVSTGRRAFEETASGIASIAEKFHSGAITSTFSAYLPEITSPGGNLELPSFLVSETFSRSDRRRVFWDLVNLGETVTEVKAPVTYLYHVSLSEPWVLEVSGQTCIVTAPPIRPALQHVHLEQMTQHVDEGWFRFDAADQLTEVLRGMQPTLREYASDPRHLGYVREHARRTVAKFVRDWLLREDHWREDRFRSIVVRFVDEPADEVGELRPVLSLEAR